MDWKDSFLISAPSYGDIFLDCSFLTAYIIELWTAYLRTATVMDSKSGVLLMTARAKVLFPIEDGKPNSVLKLVIQTDLT